MRNPDQYVVHPDSDVLQEAGIKADFVNNRLARV